MKKVNIVNVLYICYLTKLLFFVRFIKFPWQYTYVLFGIRLIFSDYKNELNNIFWRPQPRKTGQQQLETEVLPKVLQTKGWLGGVCTLSGRPEVGPTGLQTAEVVSDMWRSWCKQIDAGYKKVRRGGDFGRARRRGRKYDIDYLFFFRC